jgi:hypothetical protein
MFLADLRTASPRFDEVTRTVLGGTGPEPALELTYRTSEVVRGSDAISNRVTFAKLSPTGIDLWVVSVTVPLQQEDSGRTKLFDKIAPAFRATG